MPPGAGMAMDIRGLWSSVIVKGRISQRFNGVGKNEHWPLPRFLLQ